MTVKYNGEDVQKIFQKFKVLPLDKWKENCSWVYSYPVGFNPETGKIDEPVEIIKPSKKKGIKKND